MELSTLTRSLQGQWLRLRQAIRPAEAAEPTSPTPSRRGDAEVSLGEKIARDRQALYDRLGTMRSDDSARVSRQSARDKVAMLRERVRMLKARIAGASGLTLKRLARQLAQVAAQLKQAVGQYVNATAKLGNAVPGAPTGSTAAPAAASGAAPAANAQPAVPQAAVAILVADTSQTQTADPQDGAARAAVETDGRTTTERMQAQEDRKMDEAFALEVKALLRELKQAADMLKRKMRHTQQNALAELAQTLREIEAQLAQLRGMSQTGTAAVSAPVAISLPGLSVDAGTANAGATVGVGVGVAAVSSAGE